MTVKESRGRLSYLTPDRTKPITARKLGDDFDRAAVLEALTINAQNAVRAAETPAPKQEYPRSIKDRLQRGKATINAPKQDSVQRMVDIAAKKAEGKGRGYEKWATLHNLKQMAATMSVYEESGFSSPEELEAALAAANTELHETTGKLKAVESTLREKKDLQKQLLAYIKTKPARDGLAGAENGESPESLPGAARKRVYHFRICRPVFQGTGNRQTASFQDLTNGRLSSLPKRKTPFTTSTGRRKRTSGNCRP